MKTVKKTAALLLAAILLFCGSVCYAQEGESIVPENTQISGVESEISALASSELKKTVSITPCEGTRTVLLQQYDSAQKKYKTVNTYITEDVHTASVVISFPKDRRKRTNAKWKIRVEESENAIAAEKIINLTSENIAKKDLSAKAVCVYCVEDKKVIYEKQPHKRLKQASLTKVMTATLLIESGKLSKKKKISKKAAKVPYSTPKMKAGDTYSNKALLYALLLPSSNGAAVAIAESVSAGTGKFVKNMNSKAKKLGLKDTHYANPHGLDAKNHYSSAYDTAVLTGYIYKKSKTFRTVISKKSYKVKSKKSKAVKIYTRDKLKDYSKKHKGGKTGYTDGAGNCFCGIYVHGGKTYVVCILCSKTDKTRWSDMKKLYSYIDKYANTKY